MIRSGWGRLVSQSTRALMRVACGGNSPASIIEGCAWLARRNGWNLPQLKNMSDPLQKIKEKLQDEIPPLERELSIYLPKQIAVPRAHGDLTENAKAKDGNDRQRSVQPR